MTTNFNRRGKEESQVRLCTPFNLDFLFGLRDVNDRFEEVVAPSSHLKDDEEDYKQNGHSGGLLGLNEILPHTRVYIAAKMELDASMQLN